MLLSVIATFVFHECGHLIAARLCGVPVRRAGWGLGGLVLAFDFSRVSYGRESLVHAAGALGGIGAAGILYALLGQRAEMLLGVSVVYALVNLLPIRGLDGGALLASVLAASCLPDRVDAVTRAVSAMTLVLLWMLVLWVELRGTPNMSLLLFVLCLLIGAVRR